MPYPILIVSPEASGRPVADALRRELDRALELAPNRRVGLAQLRRNEYSVVLLDEELTAPDQEATDALYQNAGGAIVLEMSFSLTGVPRIARQVKTALRRRAHDQQIAHQQAAIALQNELNASLTGLLLESQLALREATPATAPKLRHLVELAGDLRDRLRAL
ncbi:hypothetical protein ACFQBQ_06180 [Granulicella cerasi]|uniref:Uncharacterized protein n=1 Tax=Granulicella cerasi TaxID=741063 RepID=A0ABW1Z773_9BACT|nr:hypothetical protein [Granulicella cerasi]